MPAAPFFLTTASLLLVVFLLPHLATSCSIDMFYCGNADNSSLIRTCGRSNLRCENGSVLFQFFGTGDWYPATNIEYPERTIKIWDRNATLLSRLQSNDCDFFYNFTTPVPGFHPSRIENMDPGSNLFNCTPDSYDFSRDVFGRSLGSPQCLNYDLHYTYRPKLPRPRDPCLANKSGAVELELLFQEDGDGYVDFSLRSIGFSKHRALDAQCFGCAITRGYCSAVAAAVEGNSSCACSRRHSYNCPRKSATRHRRLLIAFVIAAVVLILSFATLFYLYMKHCKGITLEEMSMLSQRGEIFLERHGALALRRYRYSELKSITNSFTENIGKGGYGTVYKGRLADGVLVAVKVLSDPKGRSGEEFINEVASIGRTNHVNIVGLLGFCYEGRRRALVYEFLCNGSLEKFLFNCDLNKAAPLRWDQLYTVAIGIARGLEYLHKGCNTRIVHFDIKPHNILLDEHFCPKISDFGLAKLCPPKESVLSMVCARGTIGYIAPVVFSRNFGPVSSKSDVYSYGMMILEMVGRRRNADSGVEKSSETYFPHWVYDHFEQDEDLATYGITLETGEIAKKMIIVGLCCIQTNPASKPTISSAVEMLEGSLANLQMPPKPYICSPPRTQLDIPTMSTSSTMFITSRC